MRARKVWAAFITNKRYLPGLLCLVSSLKTARTSFPFLVLHTKELEQEVHAALDARGIWKREIDPLPCRTPINYNDPRFNQTWTKLRVFSLTEFERVVLLDCDMIVLQNIDDLMDLKLDSVDLNGKGDEVFAACHVCACNPTEKSHYPQEWTPSNCAYKRQHLDVDSAQECGPPPLDGVAMLNGGLLVVNPSASIFASCMKKLETSHSDVFTFADQEFLSDSFFGRWKPLPYVYNALWPMQRDDCHSTIWRDDKIKVIHFVMEPKPWEEDPAQPGCDASKFWLGFDQKRAQREKALGIVD